MGSVKYPGLVKLDIHWHPVWYLGFCLGSKTIMRPRPLPVLHA